MKTRSLMALLISHLLAVGVGFAGGIYALPIIIAPDAPQDTVVAAAAKSSLYRGEFTRDREDSDTLHWGEGVVSIASDTISFSGTLAPGPDYKLYLSPQFVETEADFNRLKANMVNVADIKTFENFIVPLASAVDPAKYNTVVVWCETFGQFITSAAYLKTTQ